MTDSELKPLVVRNGYLPQRELITGIGPVDIKVPKTRDRGRPGKRPEKSLSKAVANVVGFTRQQTSSTNPQNTVRLKQNKISMMSG